MNYFWRLEQYGDASAFVQDNGQELSYRQAAQDADQLAQQFGESKRLVFILCENDVESVIAYLACLRSGHVPLLLNADIEEELFTRLCICYRPHFIWRRVEIGGAAPTGNMHFRQRSIGTSRRFIRI